MKMLYMCIFVYLFMYNEFMCMHKCTQTEKSESKNCIFLLIHVLWVYVYAYVCINVHKLKRLVVKLYLLAVFVCYVSMCMHICIYTQTDKSGSKNCICNGLGFALSDFDVIQWSIEAVFIYTEADKLLGSRRLLKLTSVITRIILFTMKFHFSTLHYASTKATGKPAN